MNKIFDTYQSLAVEKIAPQIKEDGYSAVALYYFAQSKFKKLLTRSIAQALTDAGLYVVSIWESGEPVTGSYFTAQRGASDGMIAAQKALAAGQPANTPIYPTVDYDASQSDLVGITAYFAAFKAQIAKCGYLLGVYGSGLVCAHLKAAGLVEYTWLSMSHGFASYQMWLPHADIVQSRSQTLYGIDVDPDTTDGSAGGWQVPSSA